MGFSVTQAASLPTANHESLEPLRADINSENRSDMRTIGWENWRPSADLDTDGDGMPNHWENENNHDSYKPSDGSVDSDGDGYTNLEGYLSWLAGAYI
jgi:hypothetical protein